MKEELYYFREGSLENAHYISALASFLSLRHSLYCRKNFCISLNNSEWEEYGDLVVEVGASSKRTINAIRCKKIENKKNYDTLVLRSDSYNFGLKEQCEIFQKLQNEKNVRFKLLTVAGLILEQKRRFVYDDEAFEYWPQFDEEKFWKKKEHLIEFWREIDWELFHTTRRAFELLGESNAEIKNLWNKFNLREIEDNKPVVDFWGKFRLEQFEEMKGVFANLEQNELGEELEKVLSFWLDFSEKNFDQMKQIVIFWLKIDGKNAENLFKLDETQLTVFRKTFNRWQILYKRHFGNFFKQIKEFKKWNNFEKAKSFWKNKEVEVLQFAIKQHDFFNTTNDLDDVCFFKILNNPKDTHECNLDKFLMYINQKTAPELEAAINSVIEEQFEFSRDFARKFIRYIKKEFRIKDHLKINERHKKLTKEKILLKITELLLEPFFICPDCIIQEKDLDLWLQLTKSFDITSIKPETDIIDKLYSALNYQLNRELKYRFDDHYFKIELDQLQNPNLKSMFFEQDGSLRFVYFTLWKANLIPLILKTETEKEVEIISKIITFLKSQKLFRNFIVITNHLNGFAHEELAIFRNLSDIKTKDTLLEKEIQILDFTLPLKDVRELNESFFNSLNTNSLLNIFWGDYFFIDTIIPLTKRLTESRIVLNEENIQKVKNYFRKQDDFKKKEGLTFLIDDDGVPTEIEVPPEF